MSGKAITAIIVIAAFVITLITYIRNKRKTIPQLWRQKERKHWWD